MWRRGPACWSTVLVMRQMPWGAALVVEWLDAAGSTVGVPMASQEVYPIAAGGPRISDYTRI